MNSTQRKGGASYKFSLTTSLFWQSKANVLDIQVFKHSQLAKQNRESVTLRV